MASNSKPCVDCGNPARNKCNKCGKPYCSTCKAAASDNRTCGQCRMALRNARAQSKTAQRHSRQVQSTIAQSVTASGTYIPPSHLQAYANPSQVNTNANNPPSVFAFVLPSDPLYLMDKPDFQRCIDEIVQELEEMLVYHQNYVNRRGSNMPTDIMYRKEIAFLQYLIPRLRDEVPILYDMASTGQLSQPSSGAHHGLTDILTEYDTHFMGQPKP